MKFKYPYIFVLFFLIAITANAQRDTTKIKSINDGVSIKNNTNVLLLSKNQNEKISPNTSLSLSDTKNIDVDKISSTIKNTQPKDNSNFLKEKQPDKDIIGRKYWNGKDVTNAHLKSNTSLGSVYTNAKRVRIVCRDHSYVDGDIIKIFLNEKPLSNSISLKASSFMVYMDLEKGYNRIDFQAMNQGSSGPNTAELLLFDENDNLIAEKEWNLPTGAIATIGVIQKD